MEESSWTLCKALGQVTTDHSDVITVVALCMCALELTITGIPLICYCSVKITKGIINNITADISEWVSSFLTAQQHKKAI